MSAKSNTHEDSTILATQEASAKYVGLRPTRQESPPESHASSSRNGLSKEDEIPSKEDRFSSERTPDQLTQGSQSQGRNATDKKPASYSSTEQRAGLDCSSDQDVRTSAVSAFGSLAGPATLEAHLPHEVAQTDNETLSLIGPLSILDKGKGKSDDYHIRFEIFEVKAQDNLEALAIGLDQIEHSGIGCDGPKCKDSKAFIQGIRYKCAVCENVDFCSMCIREWTNTHNGCHKMIRCKVPTTCRVIRKFDEATRKALLADDPTANESDILHVILAETDRSAIEPSILQYIPEDIGATIFAIVKDQNPEPQRYKGIVTLEPQPQNEDYVTGYRIDEALNVSRTHQAFSDSRRAAREAGVIHHDAETVAAAMFGEVTLYNYISRTQFYDLIQEGSFVTRVVDLLPGTADDKLEVVVRTVDINDGPIYEALSYTWKETAFTRAHHQSWNTETDRAFTNMMEFLHPAYCGQEFFKIGVGLRDALRSLRHESETQTFWVDQISINQDDVGEKSFHVQRMPGLYNRAKRTVVWVGDEDDDSKTATTLIRKLSLVQQHHSDLLISPEKLQTDTSLGFPPAYSSEWMSLFRFFARPVFDRMWVIQEIVVSQDVVIRCGPNCLSWNELCLAAKILFSPPWLDMLRSLGADKDAFLNGNNKVYHIIHIKGFRQDFHALNVLTMERLLYSTSKFDASDGRDKVYACLGLRSAKMRPLDDDIRPNYTSSIQECFIDTTKWILEHERSFAVCGMNTALSTKTVSGLPSWVPDMSLTSYTCTFALSRPDPPPPYQAAGDSEICALFPYASHPSLLVTSSGKVGAIAHISSEVFSNTESESEGRVLGEWARLCSKHCGLTYRKKMSSREAFWRTLVADTTPMWRRSPAPDSYRDHITGYISKTIMEYLVSKYGEEVIELLPAIVWSTGLVQETETSAPQNGREYTRNHEAELGFGAQVSSEAIGALNTVCHGRRFFTTDSNFMGIGPADAKVGDKVHVLAGGKVPFIFRNVNKSNREDEADLPEDLEDGMQVYHMLGETYVHGIMKGEAVAMKGFEWSGVGVI